MKSFIRKNFSFLIFLVIALGICVGSAFISAHNIQHSSYLERAKSLNQVMSKIGDHLNIAFQIRWDRARALTMRIEGLETDSVEGLVETLDDIYRETGADFRVIDGSGIAYYGNGRQEYWKDHRAVLPKTETFVLSPLQFGINNENYMKYIVPLHQPLDVGDVRIMYAVLTEPLSDLNRDFDTGTYGEDCLSFIISKSGTFIYENGSGDRMADSYNFLAYLEKAAEFQYGESFENFKENIQNGINNTVLIEYNGVMYYMSHFNLAMEDWVSILLVPEKNTQAEDRSFAQKLLSNLIVIFACAFCLFVIGFLFMWKKTVTRQRLAAEAERRSNEAKTNFLSSMSHDIRTPMNAIIGLTEIALHHRSEIPYPVLENLEKIYLSSMHMLMLVNDILDISKIESGKMSLNIAEFSIVEATDTLANLIRPLAKEKNIDLRMHTYNYRQEYLLGDELRISQVCINLATNAIKYTPDGGRVEIDFRQEFPPEYPDKVYLTCTVRDNGIGMSREYQKIMYETFSRGTDSRVNQVPGTGLGLAICRKMVEMMDGTLECESELGKGTRFSATVVLEKGRPDEQYTLAKLRILVIDRDKVSTDALGRVFTRLDVEADIINDPATLSALLSRSSNYAMAFVELGAPENRGIDIVRTLRRRFGEQFPIVLTDIADMAEYSELIASVGVEQTMYKPYFYRTTYMAIFSTLKGRSTDVAAPDKREGPSVAGLRVLVAEDNDLNWEILCELLKINGVTAQRATNGRHCLNALAAAQAGSFDAVLMDVRMPVMDGREATRRLRSANEEWLRTIPIIAMTADAFAEDIIQCREAGMDAHLAKPIQMHRLLSVLSDLTGRQSVRGQAAE